MTGNAEKGLTLLRDISRECEGALMIGPDTRRLLREFLRQYDEVVRLVENLHDVPSYIRRLEDFTRRRG